MAKSLFEPIKLSGIEIPNRIIMSPMCQYCVEGGLATDWQHVHLCSRAVGGTGLVMTEAAAVEPRGRITPFDLGIWTDEHANRLKKSVSFIKNQGSVPGIQLSHAGRKASHAPPRNDRKPLSPVDGGWEVIAPSDIPYPEPGSVTTKRMELSDISAVVESFQQAADRANEIGFEVLEIHAAHGYLFHQFLSPISNQRQDEYGGTFSNRTRLLCETINKIKEVWPNDKSIIVRISATDWMPAKESWTIDSSIQLASELSDMGVDLIDVSAGGIHPNQNVPESGPGYQVPYAEQIGNEVDIPVSTVGKITSPQHASSIIQNDRADMVALGREFLRNPYWPLEAAHELNEPIDWPTQYSRGKFD